MIKSVLVIQDMPDRKGTMFSSIVIAYYLLLNLATFVIYGWDKSAARAGRWRTRESVLLTLSILGGAFGGLLGMMLFHHKTRHTIFWVVNILGIAIHLYLMAVVLRG